MYLYLEWPSADYSFLRFGDTSYLQYFYPNYTRDTLYEVFYVNFVLNHFSVADYWKDPHHIDMYLQVEGMKGNASYNLTWPYERLTLILPP